MLRGRLSSFSHPRPAGLHRCRLVAALIVLTSAPRHRRSVGSHRRPGDGAAAHQSDAHGGRDPRVRRRRHRYEGPSDGQVIEERRRELFAEGGHRLNDYIRFRGTPFDIPFKGEPDSIHRTGVDATSLPYGTATCYRLPTVERIGKPNITG